MLRKNSRLRKQEVAWLLKKGRKIGAKYFVLYVIGNKKNRSRFCVVISKKTLKESFQRIALRRRIYEVIRKNPEKQGKNMDVAFIAKPLIAKIPRKQIEPAVLETLENILRKYE